MSRGDAVNCRTLAARSCICAPSAWQTNKKNNGNQIDCEKIKILNLGMSSENKWKMTYPTRI